MDNNKNISCDVNDRVDYSELKFGIDIEKEHTDDIDIATKIATDHLKEDPKYYTKLSSAGIDGETKKPISTSDPKLNVCITDKTPKGNMGGTIGSTKSTELNSYINNTIDVELDERQKSTRTSNVVKQWAKKKYDKYPFASNRNKTNFKNGYIWMDNDLNGVESIEGAIEENKKNTSIMNKYKIKDVKRTIKELVKEALEDTDYSAGDGLDTDVDSPDSTSSTDTDDTTDTADATVTITMDKDMAQKLHELLMSVLDTESGDSTDTDDMTNDSSALQESRKLSAAKSIVNRMKR